MSLLNTPTAEESSNETLVHSRKHLAAYVLPVFMLLIISRWVSFDFSSYSGFLFLFIGLPTAILCILKIISLRSVSWILTEEELIIKSGYLPWRKIHMVIPIEDIYEALCSHGMFGSLLGYGNISIRRTEGVTSHISYITMDNHKKITGAINSLVRPIKKARVYGPSNPVATYNGSLVDELTQIMALKDQGVITAEEFQALKTTLISGRR